jgi:LuxR family transcriptional regulator, maltose regulon positive regulatory protein
LRERARSWEAVAHAWYGDLATATRIAAEVAEGLTAGSGDLAPILAVSQARAHVARDEPEAAAMLLDQADQAAAAGFQPAGEPVIGVLTGMMRTRIAIDDGNATGARGLVRLLTETVAGEPGPAAAIAVLDAEISLVAGEPDRARSVIATAPAEAEPGSQDAEVCRARLLMADHDDKGALKLLEPIMSGPPSGPVAARLSALLTAVIAHRRLNQATEAAERLEEALAVAEPDDQSGAFIAAGTPIRSALTVLITPASRCAGFAGRILDRFDGRLPHTAGQPSGTPLTESELAVLRFLPSHMTNQEIAESLFLSINTIKTHLSSVYRKLGVSSRRQAIAQGRRLDLL